MDNRPLAVHRPRCNMRPSWKICECIPDTSDSEDDDDDEQANTTGEVEQDGSCL